MTRTTTALALGLSTLLAGCPQGGAPSRADALAGADADATGGRGSTPGAPQGRFVLGQNPAGVDSPRLFFPIEDGAVVDLQLGHQGLWMVVLAIQTSGVFAGTFDLEVEVEAEGGVIADQTLSRVRTIRWRDGNDYLLNWFIAVEGLDASLKPGRIRVRAWDESGAERFVEREISYSDGSYPEVEACPPSAAEPPGTLALECAGEGEGVAVHGAEHLALAIAREGAGHAALGLAASKPLMRLWRLSGGEVETLATWPAAAEARRPLLVSTQAGLRALWSDAAGVQLGLPDGALSVVDPDAEALAAFATPGGGLRVLLRGPQTHEILTLDSTGASLDRHFVNHNDDVGPIGISVSGDSVLMPFVGTDPAQPLMAQTTATSGAQCSLPTALDAWLGEGADPLGLGGAYGYALAAFTRVPAPQCAPRPQVLARTLSGEGFGFESPTAFGDRVTIVDLDHVAALVSLVPDATRTHWTPTALYLDMLDARPGAVARGTTEAGPPPAAWAAAPDEGGAWRLIWSTTSGVTARRVCLQP